jgi:hypothetical protein
MQGTGHAGVIWYFKCPVTPQMRYPVNAYQKSIAPPAGGCAKETMIAAENDWLRMGSQLNAEQGL